MQAHLPWQVLCIRPLDHLLRMAVRHATDDQQGERERQVADTNSEQFPSQRHGGGLTVEAEGGLQHDSGGGCKRPSKRLVRNASGMQACAQRQERGGAQCGGARIGGRIGDGEHFEAGACIVGSQVHGKRMEVRDLPEAQQGGQPPGAALTLAGKLAGAGGRPADERRKRADNRADGRVDGGDGLEWRVARGVQEEVEGGDAGGRVVAGVMQDG